jgi:NAD-dependent dihydropyrimidine dehydrogenase PreA subunit
LSTFYNVLSEFGETYYPRIVGRSATYEVWKGEEVDSEELLNALKSIRPVEPLKEFFLTSREKVSSFPQLFSRKMSPKVIVGAKDCDIRTLIEIQDNIYLKGDTEDPFYKERREKNIIVTVDCPEPEETCFCLRIGGKPYSTWGGDLNISFGDDGIIVDILSPKGQQIAEKLGDIIKAVPDEELKKRDKQRAAAERKLVKINPEEFAADLAEKIESQLDTDFWLKALANCVDCQACERICPTCYCFLLYDEPVGKGFERTKVLDFCYHAAYGRVGGGANPLASFGHRLRNRFECKFMAFPRNYKVMACTGCGRCISACSGKIDIREVLRAL